MFRNTFQKGFLSVFYSIGSKPLLIWDTKTSHGNIKRITDEDAKSLALDIRGVNVETCYITAPNAPCKSLGIKLPFLTIIVKNLRKSFSFEVQILDDRNQLRRFRSSNYQSQTRVTTFATSMPLKLNCGWNQVQLNLAEFTRKAYGTNYMEAVRITVHANCRLRNIYFSDRLYSDEEKPVAFKFVTKDEPRFMPQTTPNPTARIIVVPNEVPQAPVETVRPTSPISHAPTGIDGVVNFNFEEGHDEGHELAHELIHGEEHEHHFEEEAEQ
jgi:hypothetical protein